jgi:hypothetical protein
MSTIKELIVAASSAPPGSTIATHLNNLNAGGGGGPSSGSVRLQRGVWQIIAIPVSGVNVNSYFLTTLATQEGENIEDLVEVVNTYRGDLDRFLSFIPSVTNPASENNFPLMYNDQGNLEVTGFWIKMKNYTHTTNDLIFSWST